MKRIWTIFVFLVLLCAVLVVWQPWETKESITYAYISGALIDAPSTVAAESFKNSGFNPVSFNTGRDTAQALMGGSAEIATLAEWPFLLASNSREDLRVLAVITSAESMGILANRDAGIESGKDLVGKRVGLPQGTSAQYLVETYFNERGILSDIIPVNLPPPQLQSALLRGDIQAMAIWQPFLEKARLKKPEDFFLLERSESTFTVVYCVVSTVSNIEKHPDQIRSLLESLIEAENQLEQRSQEAIDALVLSTGVERDILVPLLDLFRFRVVIDDEIVNTWEKLAVWAAAQGLVPPETLDRDWHDFLYTEALESIDPNRVNISNMD